MPSYDPNNVFAKILRGELPCHKVYEDDRVLAFLDIMPRAAGHTLVIPKAPVRNILDVGSDDRRCSLKWTPWHCVQTTTKLAATFCFVTQSKTSYTFYMPQARAGAPEGDSAPFPPGREGKGPGPLVPSPVGLGIEGVVCLLALTKQKVAASLVSHLCKHNA